MRSVSFVPGARLLAQDDLEKCIKELVEEGKGWRVEQQQLTAQHEQSKASLASVQQQQQQEHSYQDELIRDKQQAQQVRLQTMESNTYQGKACAQTGSLLYRASLAHVGSPCTEAAEDAKSAGPGLSGQRMRSID